MSTFSFTGYKIYPMKYLLILFISVLAASCNNNTDNEPVKDRIDSVLAAAPQHDSVHMDKMKMQNPMLESMMATMRMMDTLKMSNNFDIDFANSMIIHHQAAIDMSELQVTNGEDVQIKDMAKKIITAQKAEIAQMQNFVAGYTIDKKMDNSDSQSILADEMKSMMDKMHNMKMTGNTDDDFVMLMIPHHASAVKMANYELTYGKEAVLKKMAQKIIINQNKEIASFVAWSTKLK
jgi:uncharacterized protein (DUF305 family)